MSKRLIAAVFLVTLVASTAHAEVVAVTVHGAATESERRAVLDRLLAAGRAASWEMDAAAFTDAEIVGCLDDVQSINECVGGAAKAKGVTHLIVVRIQRQENTATLTAAFLTLGRSRYARTLDSDTCTKCRGDQLAITAAALASKLIKRTRLTVKGAPSGARITLDNKPIIEGAPISTPPGMYTLRCELSGYAPHSKLVSVEAGREVVELLDLEPARVAESPRLPDHGARPPRWGGGPGSHAVKATLIGAGAGLTALGAFAAIYDPEGYPRAQALGVGGLIVGAVVLGGAFYLDSSLPRSRVPTISVLRGGASVGWAGAF